MFIKEKGALKGGEKSESMESNDSKISGALPGIKCSVDALHFLVHFSPCVSSCLKGVNHIK